MRYIPYITTKKDTGIYLTQCKHFNKSRKKIILLFYASYVIFATSL